MLLVQVGALSSRSWISTWQRMKVENGSYKENMEELSFGRHACNGISFKHYTSVTWLLGPMWDYWCETEESPALMFLPMWRKFCEIGNVSVECLWSFSNSICGGTRNCSFEDLIFVFEASVTFKNSNKRKAHKSLGGITWLLQKHHCQCKIV